MTVERERERELPLLHLGAHGGVELGETLTEAGLGRHGLCDAAGDAAALAAREGLGGEVVDAGVEAVVHEVAKDGHKLLDLALLEAVLELARFGLREAVHFGCV